MRQLSHISIELLLEFSDFRVFGGRNADFRRHTLFYVHIILSDITEQVLNSYYRQVNEIRYYKPNDT